MSVPAVLAAMQIKPITELTSDVESLLQQSRDYQNELYPPESVHQDDTGSLLSASTYFIGAYRDRLLVGIGAVKIADAIPAYGEVKNLFIPPEHRGMGAARIIMANLESHLTEQGVGICRLETGPGQLESIGLYHSLGYRDCELYGDYQPDPLSLFMDKELSAS
ncbi:MAG: putative acetyltransferase [Gammaproteobacteria bacterium]